MAWATSDGVETRCRVRRPITGRCRAALVVGTADGGDHGGGVLQRLARHDARGWILLDDQVHDHLAPAEAALVAQFVGPARRTNRGSARPIRLETVAMVLAVNCAPQAPAERQALVFQLSDAASDVSQTDAQPTTWSTSCTVTSLFLNFPGQDQAAVM